MNISDVIKKLSDIGGVSGCEQPAADAVTGYLEKYNCEIRRENGGVIAVFNKGQHPRTVIDAHIDRIGFTVTDITDDGFLKFSAVGGIDGRILPARHVIINGKETLKGVICSVPPHLKNGDDTVSEISDMYIDPRLSPEEAKELVSPGDTVYFDVSAKNMLGTRMTGAALDNRCGAAAVLFALENTDIASLRGELDIVFAYQEEIGMRGAATASYISDCDTAIAVDVSFALSKGEKEERCGILGKGCMIGFAPSLDRKLSKKLVDIAKKNNIPYQIEAMDGTTGTDADRYGISRGGAKTATLSVPLRYMHTPAEVIDVNDVENTGRLIAAFIGEEC